MGEKDKKIEQLKKDLTRARERAFQAAMIACDECDQVHHRCETCICKKIREDAEK